MNVSFELNNKKIDESFNVTLNGQTQVLDKNNRSITFYVKDSNEIEFEINNFTKDMLPKNPLAKCLAIALIALLSPFLLLFSLLIFISYNYFGIDIHGFFEQANPFKINKRFRISSKESGTVSLKYLSPKYNKQEKSYSDPDILIQNFDIIYQESEVVYDRKSMKLDFIFHHYPAYISFSVFIATCVLFMVILSLKLILKSLISNLLVVIVILICLAFFVMLFTGIIRMFYLTNRLYKQVDEKLINRNAE